MARQQPATRLAHEWQTLASSPSSPRTCGGEGWGEEVYHPLIRPFMSQPCPAWFFPAAHSRVARPPKLRRRRIPALRPACQRNTGANAAATREGLHRSCHSARMQVAVSY